MLVLVFWSSEDLDPWSKLPAKFNGLFIGPLPVYAENSMQVRSEVFVQSS